MSENNKYKVVDDEYIKVPKSVINNLKLSSLKGLSVLLHFLDDGQEEANIQQIAQKVGCDEETVIEAMGFWTYVGVLIKNEDKDKLVENKLEIMLKRAPLPYETKRVINTIKESGIDFQVALKILDIGIEEDKKTADWAVGVIKTCAKSKDQAETCDGYRRYFSLMRNLIKGLEVTRDLTSKEKTIIFEWAKNKVPLEYIYNVYLRSKQYTNRTNFQYMNSIISKADPSLLVNDGELGY